MKKITRNALICPYMDCPKCGSHLVVRRKRFGGHTPFLGCIEYPKCKGTMSLQDAKLFYLNSDSPRQPHPLAREVEASIWNAQSWDKEEFKMLVTGISAIMSNYSAPTSRAKKKKAKLDESNTEDGVIIIGD